MEDKDSIMRRVRKLLAIAEDGRANPHEAASAAAMASKIMRKYQLEHADLVLVELRSGTEVNTEEVKATAKTNGTPVKEVPPWASWIGLQVARLNDCGCRLGHSAVGEKVVRFYGYSSDTKVAAYMFSYLVDTVNRLCREFIKTSEDYRVYGRRVVNGYRQGVAQGIVDTLKKEIAAKQAEEATPSSGTSLVVVKKEAVVEKFGNVYGERRGTTKVSRGESFSAGFRDGQQVTVRKGVTGGGATARLK